MTSIAKQVGVNRIVLGTNIPYPCGDPNMSEKDDLLLRREIVKCALNALQTEVGGPTIFTPNVVYTTG
jgi:glycine reductase